MLIMWSPLKVINGSGLGCFIKKQRPRVCLILFWWLEMKYWLLQTNIMLEDEAWNVNINNFLFKFFTYYVGWFSHHSKINLTLPPCPPALQFFIMDMEMSLLFPPSSPLKTLHYTYNIYFVFWLQARKKSSFSKVPNPYELDYTVINSGSTSGLFALWGKMTASWKAQRVGHRGRPPRDYDIAQRFFSYHNFPVTRKKPVNRAGFVHLQNTWSPRLPPPMR